MNRFVAIMSTLIDINLFKRPLQWCRATLPGKLNDGRLTSHDQTRTTALYYPLVSRELTRGTSRCIHIKHVHMLHMCFMVLRVRCPIFFRLR